MAYDRISASVGWERKGAKPGNIMLEVTHKARTPAANIQSCAQPGIFPLVFFKQVRVNEGSLGVSRAQTYTQTQARTGQQISSPCTCGSMIYMQSPARHFAKLPRPLQGLGLYFTHLSSALQYNRSSDAFACLGAQVWVPLLSRQIMIYSKTNRHRYLAHCTRWRAKRPGSGSYLRFTHLSKSA